MGAQLMYYVDLEGYSGDPCGVRRALPLGYRRMTLGTD